MSETEYIVLWSVLIAGKHQPTGKTVHYAGNNVLPTSHSLQIAQYLGDDGYCLFYLDEGGAELTDTFHDDVRSAMDQAKWEFGVEATEWEKAV